MTIMRSFSSLKPLVVVLAATLIFCGNVQAERRGKPLYAKGLDYVRIVEQDAWKVPNDHPFAMTEEEMRNALSSLRYSRSSFLGLGGSSDKPIFAEDQINILAEYVTQGLRMARDHDDIIFSVTGAKDDLLGSEYLITSGRVFVADGNLNIIFGLVDSDYQVELDREDYMEYIWRLQRGERGLRSQDLSEDYFPDSPVEAGYRSEEGDLDGATLLSGGKIRQKRVDWLVVELPPRSAIELQSMAVAEERAIDEESIRARHEGKARGTATSPRPDYRSAPAAATAAAPAMTIDQRLAKLKSLKDAGLIDEATYQEKMQEIVDEL